MASCEVPAFWRVHWHTYVTENHKDFKCGHEASQFAERIRDAFRLLLGISYDDKIKHFAVKIVPMATKKEEWK